MGKFARVAVPAMLLLLIFRWISTGLPSDASGTTNVPYVLTPEGLPPSNVIAGLEGPVHNWTLSIQGRAYGLEQWGRSDCSFYFGRLVTTRESPAIYVAAVAACAAALIAVLAACIASRLTRCE